MEEMFKKIGKNTPYRIPEEYLDNFTSQMMAQYKKCTRPRYRLSHFLKYASVAAIIIFFAIPGYLLLKTSDSYKVVEISSDKIQKSELTQSIQQLSDEELVVLTSLFEDDIYKDQF